MGDFDVSMERRMVLGGMLVWVVRAGGRGALAVGRNEVFKSLGGIIIPRLLVALIAHTIANQADPPTLLRGEVPGTKAKKQMPVTD